MNVNISGLVELSKAIILMDFDTREYFDIYDLQKSIFRVCLLCKSLQMIFFWMFFQIVQLSYNVSFLHF